MGLINKCISPPTYTAVQAGRLGFLTFPLPESSVIVWNVHNYDLQEASMHDAFFRISQQTAAAKADPLKSALFLLGDFNLSRNNHRFYIDPLDHASHSSSPSLHTNNLTKIGKSWQTLFRELVEVET